MYCFQMEDTFTQFDVTAHESLRLSRVLRGSGVGVPIPVLSCPRGGENERSADPCMVRTPTIPHNPSSHPSGVRKKTAAADVPIHLSALPAWAKKHGQFLSMLLCPRWQ